MALLPNPQLPYTDGNRPPNGFVGEYQEALILQVNAISLTSGSTINFLTLNLLPGEWDIDGYVNFGTGLLTISNNVVLGVSQTSQTFITGDPRSGYRNDTNRISMTLPAVHQSIVVGNNPLATTPVYFVLQTTFTLTTLTAWGYFRARRPI